MSNLALIQKIKEMYDSGQNVMQFLKHRSDASNDVESIMISYDLQAGSYTEFAKENQEYFDSYTDAIIETLSKLQDHLTALRLWR